MKTEIGKEMVSVRYPETDHSPGFLLALVLVVIAVIVFVTISVIAQHKKSLAPPKKLPKLKKPSVVDQILGDDGDNPWPSTEKER